MQSLSPAFIDSLVQWLNVSLIHWFKDSWSSSLHWLFHWFVVSLLWFIGSLFLCFDWLIRWFPESLIHWFTESLIQRFIASLDSRIEWFIGSSFTDNSLVHAFIDSSIHWFTGSFRKFRMVSRFQHFIASAPQKPSYKPLMSYSQLHVSKTSAPARAKKLSGTKDVI